MNETETAARDAVEAEADIESREGESPRADAPAEASPEEVAAVADESADPDESAGPDDGAVADDGDTVADDAEPEADDAAVAEADAVADHAEPEPEAHDADADADEVTDDADADAVAVAAGADADADAVADDADIEAGAPVDDPVADDGDEADAVEAEFAQAEEPVDVADEPVEPEEPADIATEPADPEDGAVAEVTDASEADATLSDPAAADETEAAAAADETAADDAVEVIEAQDVDSATDDDSAEPPVAEDSPTAEGDPDAATVAVATTALAASAAATVALAASPAASPDRATSATAIATETDASAPSEVSPAYAWAPAEPKPKKKHTAVWISAVAGVAVVGLVVSSLLLIAPGTTVAGVPVGWLTPGAAADAIEQQLAETTVVLTGPGEDVEVTGAELGAVVDAQALADAAFAEHPMWNPTAWFATTDGEVELDAETATDALREAAPQLYTDPVDATLAFDPATATYVATAAVPGAGVDVAAVQAAIQAAFEAGETRVELEPVPAEVAADIPTETADATVAQLNGMLDAAGFYIGDERTVPVDRATLAAWLTVEPDPENAAYAISADTAAIQAVVDGLPAAVNRPAENGAVITNSAGKVLREEATGQSGREVGDTSTVAADFGEQLATGNAAFQLPVTVVEPVITTLARTIEVDLSSQTAHLMENGTVVRSYTISSGRNATPTPTGRFTVNAYTRVQDMGALCYNPAAVNSYCTEDVPWITWFAPDIAFHGASAFRSALGFQQSHGCVNMWDADAKFVYDWTAKGTEVWVHA